MHAYFYYLCGRNGDSELKKGTHKNRGRERKGAYFPNGENFLSFGANFIADFGFVRHANIQRCVFV